MADHVIRVLIADDHRIVRDGLRLFLANSSDISVVGEVANGKLAVDAIGALRPDVILMDLVMPVLDGTTAIKHIRHRAARVRILALTSFQERHLVQEAIQAGADGFLYKDCTPEELVQAIRNLSGGYPALSPRATQALIQTVAGSQEPMPKLSDRERQVLAMVAGGATNAEIAKALSLSPSTVGFHLGNILTKLGANNRAEAVSLAHKYRLIPPA